MPIAISGKKSVCVTAVNEQYTIAPDLTAGQTIEWSLDGKALDAKYNVNPTAITWADFASGITAATTKNLVAVVKDSAGNVVSTSPTFPVAGSADTGYNNNHRLNWQSILISDALSTFLPADWLAYFFESVKNYDDLKLQVLCKLLDFINTMNKIARLREQHQKAI